MEKSFSKNLEIDLCMVGHGFSFLTRLLGLPPLYREHLPSVMPDRGRHNSTRPQNWTVAVLDRAPGKEWPADGIISATRVGRFKHYTVAWKQSCISTDCLRRQPGPNTESWRIRILEWRNIDGAKHIVVDWEPTTVRRCAFESPGGRRLLREYRQRVRTERARKQIGSGRGN